MANLFNADGTINQNYLMELSNPNGGNSGNSPGDSGGMFGGQNPGYGGQKSGDIGSLLGMLQGLGGGGQNAGGTGFGMNLPTLNAAIGGIGQLGGLYLGIKQLGLAKDSFKLQKEAYKTNLANQTQSYNTQVGDKIAGRSYATEEERQAALKAAQLPVGG